VLSLQEFSSSYSNPDDIKNCGDGRLFIVEKTGTISICDSAGIKNTTPFLDVHTLISTGPGGERGLLGLAFHPDYASNGYFYIYYTKAVTGALRISRFTTDSLNPNVADPNSELNLMEIPHPTNTNHNGGCLQFGPDGYLYIGTGDGGSAGDPPNNAQNTQIYLGKLLRIDVNTGTPYAVPPDNPFVNDSNYFPEIWAYGLRNPWRFSFDKITGDLWIGDVGQDLWEEVDYVTYPDTGGQNYGWKCYEGNHPYAPSNCTDTMQLTFPVAEYAHSEDPDGDCSETGGYVYRGTQYPNMYGKYFFVDYCSGKFRVTTKNADGTFTTELAGDELITADEFNFASFGEDRYGELYVAGITDGKIYKVADVSTGIDDPDKSDLTIYPNPAGSNFILAVNNGGKKITVVEIRNMAGQLVTTIPFSNTSFDHTNVNVSTLQQGIYFVKIECGNVTTWKKLVVSR
jgi:glucose/arabinose dehydrogenase